MEVHAHTHTERKKFTHYLWEFLMLFLAVFCGFLAENIREHQVEKEREKKFIKNLVEDLSQDTTTFTQSINNFSLLLEKDDSLIQLLNSPDIKNYGSALYYMGRLSSRSTPLAIHDATIQQLKNSGGFRLIRNDEVAKKIMEYYNLLVFINYLQQVELLESEDYRKIAIDVFDPLIFNSIISPKANSIDRPLGNPALLTYDIQVLRRLSYKKNITCPKELLRRNKLTTGQKIITFSMKKYLAPALKIFCCGLLISFQSNAQQFSNVVKQFISVNADTLALTHVKIVDGTGGISKPDQTIIIIKGIINKVGGSPAVTVPANAKTIDCSGKTIIPGMVMMHEHLFYGEFVAPYYLGLAMPFSFPRLYLAGGVTTMRTTGTVEPQTDLNIRNDINEGKTIGPNIDVTGPYIERAGLPIPEMLYIKSPEDAIKEVNYWADMGCTSFKLYMDLTRADAKAAIDAAHKRGLKVTGHLCSITFREAADLGIDNLEHGFLVSSDFDKNKKQDQCNNFSQSGSIRALDENSAEMKALIQYLIQKKVSITSTLPVFEPYTGREIFPGGGGVAVVAPVRETVEKGYKASIGKDSVSAAMFKKEMAWEKQFVEMGGRLMAGVDPTGAGRTIPGYADRHTLELLVEAGFNFSQAVKICTLNAAEYLGRDKEIGTIAEGKKADLVLITGDPEKQVRNVRNTEIVFKNGVGFDSKKLFESVKGKVGLY